MKIKPTYSRRNVFLDIETLALDQANPEGALSALTGRVVCIGLLIDDGQTVLEHSLIDSDELALLRSFWALVRPGDLFVGFNILDFDLPFIRQRCWINSVRPSRRVDLRRYYSADCLDLMQTWCNWHASKYPKLDTLASVLGCGKKNGRGDEVGKWWAAGQLDRIAEYCRNDVRITCKLFHRMMFQSLPDRFKPIEPVSESDRNF
ncbi:MAG: ribonuclease H-like domain-containing protein [Terriglobales bacterium]